MLLLQCDGPFDLVVMDMSFSRLLRALMLHCHDHEAQRVVSRRAIWGWLLLLWVLAPCPCR